MTLYKPPIEYYCDKCKKKLYCERDAEEIFCWWGLKPIWLPYKGHLCTGCSIKFQKWMAKNE